MITRPVRLESTVTIFDMPDLPEHLRLRFSGLEFAADTPHGWVYVGQSFIGQEVSVAILSEAAAADPRLRAALGEALRQARDHATPDQPRVHSADLAAREPWVAVTGRHTARQLLAAVGDAGTASDAEQRMHSARPRRMSLPRTPGPLEVPAFLDQSPMPPSPGRALGDYLVDRITSGVSGRTGARGPGRIPLIIVGVAVILMLLCDLLAGR
jgi:hypothetical protein